MTVLPLVTSTFSFIVPFLPSYLSHCHSSPPLFCYFLRLSHAFFPLYLLSLSITFLSSLTSFLSFLSLSVPTSSFHQTYFSLLYIPHMTSLLCPWLQSPSSFYLRSGIIRYTESLGLCTCLGALSTTQKPMLATLGLF